LDYETAQSLAKAHPDAQSAPDSEYRWTLRAGLEVEAGWYFDHTFEHTGDLPESEWACMAGAPGFLVPRNGGPVRIISWDELVEIQSQP
jgi:hypothetical protein